MFAASLYCSNNGCNAVFDGRSRDVEALYSLFCRYCGAQLEVAVWATEVSADEPRAGEPTLRVVNGPFRGFT